MLEKCLNINSKLTLTSNSKQILTNYIKFLCILFKKLNIKYSILFLPTMQKRITLLKSPHVNKKSKEHFELNTFRAKIILKSTEELTTIKNFLINRPTNIQLKIHF